MNYNILLAVLLQSLTLCLGHEVTTVIDTKEELQVQAGDSFSDSYCLASANLSADSFPQAILDSGSKGIWLFSESATSNGGIFTLSTPTTITNISFVVYTTKKVLLGFRDKAQDDVEVSVQLSRTAGESWAQYVVLHERDFASTAPFTIRFYFPTTNPPTEYGHILVDRITIVGEHLHVTEETTTEVPTTTVDEGDEVTAGSAAVLPAALALALVSAIFINALL